MGTEEGLLPELRKLRRRVERLEKRMEGLKERPFPREERVKTFVVGFDEALEGGVPRGHVVMLHGPPGTMKTALALYIVSMNREAGMSTLYVSLEETRESLRKTMEGFDIQGNDFIVDIATMRLEHGLVEEAGDWLQILKSYLQNKEDVDMLVIDPFNSLYPLAHLTSPRRDLFHFFRFLKDTGMTSFLIYEGTEFPYHEEYMADCVIEVAPRELERGQVALWMRCVKLRQSAHSRDYFQLEFQDGRFRGLPVVV